MDLADRITALQRKKASGETSAQRTRGVVSVSRAERATAPAPDQSTASAAALTTAAADRGSRRPQETSPRRSAASPQQQGSRTKHLFNPDTDPIPLMRPPRPQLSETSSPPSVHAIPQTQAAQRQLFDPRKDDPMRFAVLNNQAQRQQAPSSSMSSSVMDHSSISSYASSTWTLTSSTGTSHSSAPPDKATDKDSGSKFLELLKGMYREISALEKRTKVWDNMEEVDAMTNPIQMLKPGSSSLPAADEPEKPQQQPHDPLLTLVSQHKQLAELYHSMISIILQPIPSSMLAIVTKYGLHSKIWTSGIAHCVECLRRLGSKYPGATEHLTSFIYWSYHLYESLYETSTTNDFMAPYKVNWMEALGDLARWQTHIAARQSAQDAIASGSTALTVDALPPSPIQADSTPPPSIGIEAARAFDLDPESEIWRKSSQTWYSMVLKETPGAGKLQHNLGLLMTDVPNEELRGVYHFIKSMAANHPYLSSRESILSLFSKPAQQRRTVAADAKTTELFVLLHGMLFTNIQLDDFQPTLARYLERLELDGAQEREWVMMSVVNIAAILQYGKPDALIKPSAGGTEPPANAMAGKKRELVVKMDSLAVSESPIAMSPSIEFDNDSMAVDVPYSLQLSLQLAFSTLSFCLRHPLRRTSQFAKPKLNPYITVLLTFVQTILKQPGVLAIIERSFPWEDLLVFINSAPRRQVQKEVEARAKLTSGCAPLPEDWCIRGMAWPGRRVYEHGFWPRSTAPGGGGVAGEMDVLLANESAEQESDGIIEDDENGEEAAPKDYTGRRWVRIIRSCLALVHYVPGFELARGAERITWRLGEAMERKAEMWREEERREREEEERRRNRHWGEDEDEDMEMDIDEEDEEELDSDPEVRALQERRSYLRSLQSGREHRRRSHYGRPPRSNGPSRPLLNAKPGYTILVVDTNVLLSTLPTVISLVESQKWTVVIPLAVITELDGISNNPNELGRAAEEASKYITNNIRTHSTSLKVQTSRGNYLTTLNVRSENLDFFSSRDRRRNANRSNPGDESGEHMWERSIDDLILRAALWQEDHWTDRSALLKGIVVRDRPEQAQKLNEKDEVAKVALVSFDRNLRLKARARQMHAGDERDLAHILRVSSSS